MTASSVVMTALLTAGMAGASLVNDVREHVDAEDFAAADKAIQAYRSIRGVTPELMVAITWIARGELASKQYDNADAHALEARKLAIAEIQMHKMDAEKQLPLALGAAIEVHGQVLAARGERAEAIAFLRGERTRFAGTSIAARIQKNILLLSLEGHPAPALETAHWLGPQPAATTGHPVLLFFWAHWCSDCKADIPVIAKIASVFGPKGLLVMGPTQHYGYVAGGEDATPEQETVYIEQVRKEYYAPLAAMPAPLSEKNFTNYGASTTPTLVLIDRHGIVRMYHPGAMRYEELAARVAAII